ncbi:cell shape-determining peptidoglycan glycosyltransferase RodA [soil metagenome]
MSARSRELLGLIPVSLLVSAGFAAVLVTRTGQQVSDATLTYGLIFLGLCVFGHLFIRLRLPDADPYLFPLAALLAAFGLVMIYRIDAELALRQAGVFVIGLVLFCATVVFLRDHHALERYRYLIAASGIALLVMPRLPGIGEQVNGAFLAVTVGPVSFQPAEFAKIAIIVFLASYLRDTGDVLVRGSLRALSVPRQALMYALPLVAALGLAVMLDLGPAGIVLLAIFVVSLVAVLRERPSLKHFGPLLLIWGLSMFMLLVIRDLGSSLMFFGGFLALLYVATARLSLIGVGATMFLGGSTVLASTTDHVQDRIDIWLRPFADDAPDGAGQITQSLFAQADGGLFGRGLGRSLLELPQQFAPDCQVAFPECGSVLPAPHTDFIYAVIVSDLGLFGAAGVVLCYLLFCARGFKTALVAGDGFSKLLAAGLTAVFALQVFVIVGGVTKVIPLTGVTLPFVSFGGSSIVANMVLLALLLIVSDSARRDRARGSQGGLV